MNTIEMLIRKGDTRLVVGITTGRKVQFAAKMQFGDRYSALTAYGNSVDAAISNLEDGLINEMAEDANADGRFKRTSNIPAETRPASGRSLQPMVGQEDCV